MVHTKMVLAWKVFGLSIVLLPLISGGCKNDSAACLCAERVLRLSSTTSVDNTGLLAAIIPPFEKRTGIKVHVLAVGTGKAIKLAENGDVDAIFVHDHLAEEAFVAAGYGVHRMQVMHNNFVIAGPNADPAGARGNDAVAALSKIAAAGAAFVSRGDNSGTNKAELRLWKAAGIEPKGNWYLESGQGQRMTLNMADEKNAYCFLDRATFISAEDQVSSKILVEGDKRLYNPYSVTAVNQAKNPEARYVEAMAFGAWLTSAECQKMIGEFKIGGKQLFHPDVFEKK
ncbi:MAG TPA: substrate-binding domain-containing protein [Myxococcota bacterium]|nr:substrate-binding domain-containing protein [Myxococcota bacterium]